jgi:tagatose 1,6-diphosphate aldolase
MDMELTPGKWWGLRRLADPAGRFKMTAVDQRPPIKNLIAERRGTEVAPYDDVCAVKVMLVEVLGPESSALLLDPHYAYPAAVHLTPPASGLILTLEDSVFADSAGGRRSAAIDHWSVAKIKATGADAVKVLAWYRPDAADDVLEHQHQFVAEIGRECVRYDIPFVFELLVYPLRGESGHTTNYVEQAGKRADHVLQSVTTFASPEFGIDLFKLESPVGGSEVPGLEDASAGDAQTLFDDMGEAAGRPWVMLSAGVTQEQFTRILVMAYRSGASGYLAGRAIWWDAFQHFPDVAAMRTELETGAVEYMQHINELTDAQATPWNKHPVYGPTGPQLMAGGPGFRDQYEGIVAE